MNMNKNIKNSYCRVFKVKFNFKFGFQAVPYVLILKEKNYFLDPDY